MFKKAVVFLAITILLLISVPVVANNTLTGVVVGQVPTIAAPGYVTLASIRYAESGTSQLVSGTTFEVTLPSGIVFQTGLSAGNYYEATSNLSVDYSLSDSNKKITYTLTRNSFLTEAAFLIKLPVVVMGSVPTSGNIAVNVVTNNPSIDTGGLSVGKNGELAVSFSITPSTVPVLSGTTQSPQTVVRTLSITENGAGAMKAGSDNAITLALPRGVLWASSSYPVQVSPALPPGVTVTAVREGGDKLEIVLNGGTTTSPTTFMITNPSVTVSYLADEGEIDMDVSGQGLSETVVLATTASESYNVTVRRQVNTSPFEIIPGRQNQALANVEIVESSAGSLTSGGDITVTLPQGLKFATPPTATFTNIKGTQPVIQSGTGDRTITFSITEASKITGNVLLNMNSTGNILVSPKFTGDVEVRVSGTAGASGRVTLANAKETVKISTESVANLTSGDKSVEAGEILIEEVTSGRIAPGVIVLDLPTGVTFSSLPSITLTAGNLPVSLGTLSNGGRTLTIPVNARSTQASKLTIGSINYKIADTWWKNREKKISVTVSGNALVDSAVSGAFTGSSDQFTVVNAEAGATQISVFTIGSKAYTVGRESKEMDQEPVIINNRTMLPLRFVGEAIGLREDEIIWDPANRTVTMFRGDRVMQVTIGSKRLLLNGAYTEMDVAPEIINGRTMLPIRWIGTALRVKAEWNETDRTVTVTPQ